MAQTIEFVLGRIGKIAVQGENESYQHFQEAPSSGTR